MSAPSVVTGDSEPTELDRAFDANAGLLRLTPTWVPGSFLHSGKRIRLQPDGCCAYGAQRDGSTSVGLVLKCLLRIPTLAT